MRKNEINKDRKDIEMLTSELKAEIRQFVEAGFEDGLDLDEMSLDFFNEWSGEYGKSLHVGASNIDEAEAFHETVIQELLINREVEKCN